MLEKVILAPHALKRLIEPDEVAQAVLFLLGPGGQRVHRRAADHGRRLDRALNRPRPAVREGRPGVHQGGTTDVNTHTPRNSSRAHFDTALREVGRGVEEPPHDRRGRPARDAQAPPAAEVDKDKALEAITGMVGGKKAPSARRKGAKAGEVSPCSQPRQPWR